MVELSPFVADRAGALPGPPWLAERRRAAATQFAATPLPTVQEEDWRYSRIADFDLARFDAPPAGDTAGEVPEKVRTFAEAVGERAALVVIRDGRVVSVEVDPDLERRGVRVGPSDAPDVLAQTPPADNALAHLHDALVEHVLVVDVPQGVAVEAPIVVAHWSATEGATTAPHLVVRAGPASQVTVVDYQASSDVSALVVPTVEVHAADAANARYLAVQDLGRDVWQMARQHAAAGQDANVALASVALGGHYSRVRTDALLGQRGGTANLVAVYFSDGDQMHDFRTLQDHMAPRTTSHLLFKGAVSGRAHSVYTGLIRVRAGAKDSDSFLANRNLVLSDEARVDSVPNLEIINENDLRNCGHASATGPIDEEHRFYLESRGIPTEVAERLIVLGFFDDVIARMPVPSLRPLLRAAVQEKLERGMVAAR